MSFYPLSDSHITVAFAVCCLTIVCIFDKIIRKSRAKGGLLPFPPGPRGHAIIGNIRDIPSFQPWLKYTEWQKQYGDIVHFKVFGEHIVVVNSVKVANDLFEKRSSVYSDRPVVPMINMMGWDFSVGLMPYSNTWRRHRRLLHQAFRPQASLNYRPIQLQKVHKFLQDLLSSPEDFGEHYRTLGTSIVMSAVYGYEVHPGPDRFVSIAERALSVLGNYLLPGDVAISFSLLRYIPAWFPYARVTRLAQEIAILTTEIQNAPLQFVKKEMESGNKSDSLVAEMLIKHDGADVDVIKHVAATAYAAGADTTASAVGAFFLAMCIYPEVQRKAQMEIDAVIGPHRLPDWDDRRSLPYIEAVYRELMRWHPVLPLCLSHATSDNDIYSGYLIPKGATVVPNIWAMTRNDKVYPNPDAFIPERFFDADGQLNDDDTVLAFGFGRRICVGRYMANATIWATIVSVLATYNVEKAKDTTGQEIDIPEKFGHGSSSHPLPFQCSIVPRSAGARELILGTIAARD